MSPTPVAPTVAPSAPLATERGVVDLRHGSVRSRAAASATLVIGGLVATTGALTMLAWHMTWTGLLQVRPGSAPMVYDTALGFALTGGGLVAWGAGRRRLLVVPAVYDVLLGVVTLLEYATDRNLGIDEAIVRDYVGAAVHPGRLAQNTAVCFVLLGGALLAWRPWRADGRRPLVLALAGSLTTGIAIAGTFGYLSGIESAYLWGSKAMAAPTAMAMLGLGASLVVIAWSEMHASGRGLESLVPMVGLVVLTITAIVWRALTVDHGPDEPIPTHEATAAVLLIGALLAGVVSLTFWYAQRAAHGRREAEGLAARLRDTSAELTASYARLQAFVETAPVAVAATSPDDRITLWNAGAEQLFGWSRDEVLAQPIPFVPPGEVERFRALRRRERRGEHLSGIEVIRTRRDGTQIPLLQYTAPIYDEAGNLIETVGVLIDITRQREERAAIEEEVTARTAELTAANQELEEYSYTVAHDLRTPLRAMNSFAEILLEEHADQLDQEGRRLLRVVSDNASTMGVLVDGLLDYFAIGRRELHQTTIDMLALVQSVVARVAARHPQRSVDVTIGPLPPAFGDPDLLQKALEHLISNAYKFTADVTVRPTVCIGGERRDGTVVYHVSDNGVGFDSAYASQLFKVFRRLHGTEIPGTGIGLAMVRRIVTRHGGDVWAEGDVGQGARFSFSLPDLG